jgi:hypothetical protein
MQERFDETEGVETLCYVEWGLSDENNEADEG